MSYDVVATKTLIAERIADGEAKIAAIWNEAANPRPEAIAAHDVDQLRACIRANFGSFECRGIVKEISTEQYAPGFVTKGVNMTPAQIRSLFRMAGLPMIDADWHGHCADCIYGPDRGYSQPCAGCGSYHPCFTPKATSRAALSKADATS